MKNQSKNIIDNSTYIKVEPEKITAIKTQILECQKNILEIMKIVSTYNMLRKKEFLYKIRLKNLSKNLKKEIINFKKLMPHPKEKDQDFVEERKTEQHFIENSDINEQLNEIKEKLKQIQ